MLLLPWCGEDGGRGHGSSGDGTLRRIGRDGRRRGASGGMGHEQGNLHARARELRPLPPEQDGREAKRTAVEAAAIFPLFFLKVRQLSSSIESHHQNNTMNNIKPVIKSKGNKTTLFHLPVSRFLNSSICPYVAAIHGDAGRSSLFGIDKKF